MRQPCPGVSKSAESAPTLLGGPAPASPSQPSRPRHSLVAPPRRLQVSRVGPDTPWRPRPDVSKLAESAPMLLGGPAPASPSQPSRPRHSLAAPPQRLQVSQVGLDTPCRPRSVLASPSSSSRPRHSLSAPLGPDTPCRPRSAPASPSQMSQPQHSLSAPLSPGISKSAESAPTLLVGPAPASSSQLSRPRHSLAAPPWRLQVSRVSPDTPCRPRPVISK